MDKKQCCDDIDCCCSHSRSTSFQLPGCLYVASHHTQRKEPCRRNVTFCGLGFLSVVTHGLYWEYAGYSGACMHPGRQLLDSDTVWLQLANDVLALQVLQLCSCPAHLGESRESNGHQGSNLCRAAVPRLLALCLIATKQTVITSQYIACCAQNLSDHRSPLGSGQQDSARTWCNCCSAGSTKENDRCFCNVQSCTVQQAATGLYLS